jgi:4-amino-4-deoxy-L-arabinose transferase-like glycosyltransferase
LPDLRPRSILLALLVLAALVYGFRLGFPDFWGSHWESRRAGIGRGMLESGDWVVPVENGRVALEKPPLYYWMIAAAMGATGNHAELGARLPSAVAAVVGLAVTWRLAVLLGGGGSGLFAVLFLLGNVVYFGHARTAEMDMVLLTVEGGATWAFLEARAGTGRRWLPVVGWALMAAGFMLKGPVGIVVPVAVILVFRIAGRRDPGGEASGWVHPGPGLLVFLLLALPWYAIILARFSDAASIFIHQTLARIGEPYDHQEPFWYFVPVLAVAFLPGTLLFPAWVREAWGGADGELPEEPRRNLRRLAVAILALLVFFSLSGSKRVYYILPLWPLLAAGAGIAVERAWAAGRTRWLAVPAAILTGVLALASVAAALVPELGGPPYFARTVFAFAMLAVMALAGAWGFRAALGGRWLRGLAFGTAVLVLGNLFVVQAVGPVSNAYRSRADFARAVDVRVRMSQPLFIYRSTNLALPFYAHRVMPFLHDRSALDRVLDAVPSIDLVLDPERMKRLQEDGYRVERLYEASWSPPGRPDDVRALVLARVARG